MRLSRRVPAVNPVCVTSPHCEIQGFWDDSRRWLRQSVADPRLLEAPLEELPWICTSRRLRSADCRQVWTEKHYEAARWRSIPFPVAASIAVHSSFGRKLCWPFKSAFHRNVCSQRSQTCARASCTTNSSPGSGKLTYESCKWKTFNCSITALHAENLLVICRSLSLL